GVLRDVAHLMTGKDLNGGVIGIAWLGVICNTSQGYGLSQSRFTGNFTNRVGLTAHEVGHNWDAVHCDGDGDCFIMCSGLGGCAHNVTRFGSRSIGDIVPFRNTRPCLTENGPTFLTQPTPSQRVCAGDPLVSLSVEVSAFIPEYQWRRGTEVLVDDGVHIFGATAASLLIVDVTEADEASDYNCVVTDAATNCSTTSDDAEIVVDSVPVIIAQPQDRTATEGDLVSFAVTVEDAFFMSFQWRKDGAPLSDDGHFFGTDTATVSIFPAELDDAGAYDCLITSLLGAQCSVTSDTATLTVSPAGSDCAEDLDGDGDIDLSDLSALLANYGMTSGANPEDGDIDGDGDVDLSDLSALLAVYGTVCE
ncbi:MAG: immunoglobulin domain-containing protein, partial [Phycisphaerae bacterium]